MNLRFLETFIWAARLKSFRLTAEKLFTTQAAISSRINALEEDLGARLFVRDSRGVSLTPAGEKALEMAEQIVEKTYALRQAVNTAQGYEGKVRIGAMDSVIHTWLSDLVSRVMDVFPRLEIELTADSAHNLRNQLQKGHLDIAFQTDTFRLDAVKNADLCKYPVCCVVAAGSNYDRQFDSVEQFAKERLITFVAQSRPHQDLLSMLMLHGVNAPRLSCVNSVAAMTRLIRDGFGIGVLPPALVREQLRQGSMVILEVPNSLSETAYISHSPLDVVATWRTGPGLESSEDVVGLARQIALGYCEVVGPRFAVPSSGAD